MTNLQTREGGRRDRRYVVFVAKLDRLTRSVKDLCGLLELFEKRKVALISVAESLDTGSAAGRLVITIMGAVSQWEREAIGERTRDALRHKRGQGRRVGNIAFGCRSPDYELMAAGTLFYGIDNSPYEGKHSARFR